MTDLMDHYVCGLLEPALLRVGHTSYFRVERLVVAGKGKRSGFRAIVSIAEGKIPGFGWVYVSISHA